MLTVRQAESTDVETVAAFVRKKAAFDRGIGSFAGEVRSTPEVLLSSMFGAPAFAHALLLEDGHHAVGFGLYYFRFSSYAGRPSLWLDDLFVDPEVRRRGGGNMLMRHLAEIAHRASCTHMAWTADDRNAEGAQFYTRVGARIVGRDAHSATWQVDPAAFLSG